MSETSTRSRGLGRRSTPKDGPRATFSQLLPYIFEQKGVLVVVIVLSVLGAAASLAQPLLVSNLITMVQAGDDLGNLVTILIALVVVSALISGYQHYLLQRTGESVVLASRKRLIARMLHLPIAQFDSRRTGDLVSRVGSDTTLLRAVLTQGLVDSVGGVLLFVGALIAMLVIDPVLLGATALVITVSIVVVTLLSGRIREASHATQAKVGELSSGVERSISAVRTVRASNATDREIAAVERHAVGAYDAGVKVARISALVVPVAGIALQVSLLVVLGLGGFRVASGDIEIGSLVAFIMLLFMLIAPLGSAFGALTSVNSALGALGRIQEIIELPTEDQNDRDLAPLAVIIGAANEAVLPDAPAIEFRDVRFSYPVTPVIVEPSENPGPSINPLVELDELAQTGSLPTTPELDGASAIDPDGDAPATERPAVLGGVSFTAPRGKRTALVGPSGAGKSTILALIERFYDPTGGEVRLGGLDIRSLDRHDLRAQIGYVEQDAPVLAGSIRDNLVLSAPDATDEQCISVLAAVNLSEVLDRDPAGLSAEVGENGVMLSGGERQRLAIARALLSESPILLLDESTSSLDGVNEQKMRDAIDAVAEDRTLIVIAHRLSTVVDSDQIVVLEHGRVIGTGTHSELVASTPLYRDLARHQLLV
ncbi:MULTISPECIES: ABC transporter ATP-binding protein [unclassified Leifsonia]|uniref:ABC transporter ATP-binding protein n=1 Tax=unclassified Leifsonia TaxID=2663824 RepID=UPI0006F25C1D|nr:MULTISPECIES: ABC transporter ATP-binding protein [unclassified Leifsonia]KQX06335.1 ABC transporter [Leifsonia sp. Root1293]KRA10619.1 ABC transporter [Leifsonia sp. Root60]